MYIRTGAKGAWQTLDVARCKQSRATAHVPRGTFSTHSIVYGSFNNCIPIYTCNGSRRDIQQRSIHIEGKRKGWAGLVARENLWYI